MIAGILFQLKVTRKRFGIATKLNGLVYCLFSGIQKIKLAGAEHRAFSKWADIYAQDAALIYDPPFFLKIYSVFSGLISLGGMLFLYSAAALSGLETADYMAFSSAYGLVSGAMMTLASTVGTIASIKPLVELAEPIMKTVPETGAGKKPLARMSGGLELSNVSFRYTEDGPLILDHINLKVRPGQFTMKTGIYRPWI